MALPIAAQAQPTPNPVGSSYATLKTPDTADGHRANRLRSLPWAAKHWYLGAAAQFLVVACIGLYIFGQLAYAMPVYWTQLKVTMTEWWGARSEMVRPTFLFLFCVLPFLVSLLLVEFLRHFNVRRITSRYALKAAQVLRRKPRAFGCVSWWSYGEMLFLVLLVVGNVLVFYHSYTRRYNKTHAAARKTKKAIATTKYFEMVGNSLGFSCLFNLTFLFIPATRNSAWMEFLAISYANGVKYHRWLGVLTVLFALAHCVTYYWVWVREHKWLHEALPCFRCSLKDGEVGHDRWLAVFGELALLCFLAISLSSIPYVRRHWFNAFYYTHQLFGLSIVFIGLHWGGAIWYILPSVLAYLVSRVVSSASAFRAVHVKEFTPLSSSFVRLVVSRSTRCDGDFQVGQFVYLNVPAISKLQWHPFTVASSPRSSATSLTLIMKSLGDWTTDLAQYCEQCQRENVLPTIFMDAYYGASLEMYDEYSTVCLIGGGIGATPLFAILEDMVAKLSAGEPLTQRVFFIFSFRELALLEEIHPMLCKIKELDPQEKFFSFQFSLTRAPSDDVLNQAIDHEGLGGNKVAPTHYADASLTQARRSVAEPLRSHAYKALMYFTLFTVLVVVIVVLEYGGGKIDAHHEELWLVQNLVEIVLVFACAALAYGFMYLEHHALVLPADATSPRTGKHTGDVAAAPLTPALPLADVHTFRDLVAHYTVAVGQRPDLHALLRDVAREHASGSDASSADTNVSAAIGVFVSGPESLKRAVDVAVAAVDSSAFDVFAEEFEL